MGRNLNDLHPYVKYLAETLVKECKKQGLNIKTTETYRTVAEQDALYAKGRTAPGKIVTNAKGSSMSSYHQWRLAFDICNNSKSDPYNISVLNKAGEIGRSLGLKWGGDFNSIKDRPHFQYTFGLTIRDLKQGKVPPNKQIPQTNEYENAVMKLHKAGITNSPDYWINSDTIALDYFKQLVINYAKQDTYEKSIDCLANKGIINSGDYWKTSPTFSMENVRTFIIKMANAL